MVYERGWAFLGRNSESDSLDNFFFDGDDLKKMRKGCGYVKGRIGVCKARGEGGEKERLREWRFVHERTINQMFTCQGSVFEGAPMDKRQTG